MPQLPLPGGVPSDFRVSPPSPSLSSLSPLAAPFTAGGRPLASDPIHNPASLGPTAPTMVQPDQRSVPADAFTFASGGGGGDGIGAGGVSYYQTYEPWKTSWPSNVSGDGSGSWIDPSQNYPFSTMDKVSAAPMDLKNYPQSQSDQRWPHTNSMLNAYHNVQEATPWKQVHDTSFYSKGSLLSNDARSSGMSPAPTEPFLDLFPNPSRSSVHADPFSNGFRSSVVGPMLKDLSDSFSLDAGSSKGYRGLPYDKYMTHLESPSTQSTDPPIYGPGSFVPTDRVVKNTSGYAASFENPCRISLEYLDNLPREQKDPVTHSTTNRTKVTIAAPTSKFPSSKGDNQVIRPCELKVKCSEGNAKLSNPCTGFDLNSSVLESRDEHNVVLDSPCWKGVPSSSQYTFSQRHIDSGNFPLENINPSGNLFPSGSESEHDRKLDSVTIGLVKPSEEKTNDENTNKKLKAENVQENVSSDNNMKDEKGKRLASAILPDTRRPQTDVMMLIKSMHDQSQVLQTSHGDDIEIKDTELELLQIAIENLQSFTERRNKLKASNDGPARSSTTAEETSAGMDNKTDEVNNNQINVGLRLADITYKKSVLEALDKIPEEDSKVQAELYKNLWIEAEASLCTMKYELQLARTKLKMMSQKHAKEVNSSCPCINAEPLSSVQPVDAIAQQQQNLGDLDYDASKESETEVPVEAPLADPAVMARLLILKRRANNAESQNQTEVQDRSNAEKSVEENNTVQNKDFSSLASSGDEVLHDEVHSDVMARLRILKRRGDVGLNAESVFPNYYSLGFAMDRDLQAPAGSSEWEHVLRDELSSPGNNPMNG